jgi:hypothetical protein
MSLSDSPERVGIAPLVAIIGFTLGTYLNLLLIGVLPPPRHALERPFERFVFEATQRGPVLA